MNWYKSSKKWEEQLDGGRACGKTPEDFEKSQVERGQKVEMEHTKIPDVAREIAMDHLVEHEDYYSGLEHMENLLTELEKKDKSK